MPTQSELFELIKYHNNKYWIENSPEISDIEYDNLVKQYLAVGGKYEDFEFKSQLSKSKYKHQTPMYSLNKAYTFDELKSWLTSVCRSSNEKLIIEPKFDGWAGKYIPKTKQLVTRGDGYIGDNISDKLPLISIKIDIKNKSINQLDYILGEIIINQDNFKKYQTKLLGKNGKPYKTPRTCLTGLLASKTIPLYNFKPLEFIDYNLYCKFITFDLLTENVFLELINFTQNEFIYPCDGLVIKIEDLKYYDSLGYTSHHPKGAIAFKFGNPSAIATLRDVKWFVGKNHTLNPVGILDPVTIAGHTITKVNLHNAENILNLNIKINDEVLVERCGEIIPDVVKVIPNKNNDRKDIIIQCCPDCGSPLEYRPPFLYCTNENCSAPIIKKLTDSCVRIGLKTFGPGTVDKLVNELNIETIDEIFSLTKQEIIGLTGFADISTNNLFNEINNIKNNNIEDWKLLSSLNIHGIGNDISKIILKYYTLDELIDIENLNIEKLLLIPGLGQIRVEDLLDGLKFNEIVLKNLLSIFENKIIISKNNINNYPKICFTGKMNNPRSYYESLAKEKGFEPVSIVNKDLSVLVTTDLSRNSSKMVKAKKLGIKIITIQEFECL